MTVKAIIKDGGVVADLICHCGNKLKISIWGLVYKYDKGGRKLGQQVDDKKNLKKCSCGRSYLVACIPDLVWNELPRERKK